MEHELDEIERLNRV